METELLAWGYIERPDSCNRFRFAFLKAFYGLLTPSLKGLPEGGRVRFQLEQVRTLADLLIAKARLEANWIPHLNEIVGQAYSMSVDLGCSCSVCQERHALFRALIKLEIEIKDQIESKLEPAPSKAKPEIEIKDQPIEIKDQPVSEPAADEAQGVDAKELIHRKSSASLLQVYAWRLIDAFSIGEPPCQELQRFADHVLAELPNSWGKEYPSQLSDEVKWIRLFHNVRSMRVLIKMLRPFDNESIAFSSARAVYVNTALGTAFRQALHTIKLRAACLSKQCKH